MLRDRFKGGIYQDVILPFTVLRRIDWVLAPTTGKVLDVHGKLKGKLENLDPQLREASMCKSDLYLISADGRDADGIKFGSTLSNWQTRDTILRLPVRQSAVRKGMEDGSSRH